MPNYRVWIHHPRELPFSILADILPNTINTLTKMCSGYKASSSSRPALCSVLGSLINWCSQWPKGYRTGAATHQRDIELVQPMAKGLSNWCSHTSEGYRTGAANGQRAIELVQPMAKGLSNWCSQWPKSYRTGAATHQRDIELVQPQARVVATRQGSRL